MSPSVPIAPQTYPDAGAHDQITVAADAAELGRVRTLVAAARSNHVRVVDAEKTPPRKIDFYVITSLATPEIDKSAGIFEDQMHILAAPDIHSLEDLTNKVVSFGPDKSESQAVGRQAFSALHVPVNETPLDLDNALDGLSTGDIEAVVILAPQPIAQLRRLATPGLHLMPWPDGVALPPGADVSAIDPRAYPELLRPDEPLPALGVESILRKNAARTRLDLDGGSLAAQLRAP